jgi:hypothetical protein
MQKHKEKLQSVVDHFNNGDYNLGYRKLIDCVLDTKKLEFYKECIELTDWKETHVPSKDILAQKLIYFQDLNGNHRYDTEDNRWQEITFGQTVSLSVKYKF